jgi:hypothetical protein
MLLTTTVVIRILVVGAVTLIALGAVASVAVGIHVGQRLVVSLEAASVAHQQRRLYLRAVAIGTVVWIAALVGGRGPSWLWLTLLCPLASLVLVILVVKPRKNDAS